jgi:hypothetical protein
MCISLDRLALVSVLCEEALYLGGWQFKTSLGKGKWDPMLTGKRTCTQMWLCPFWVSLVLALIFLRKPHPLYWASSCCTDAFATSKPSHRSISPHSAELGLHRTLWQPWWTQIPCMFLVSWSLGPWRLLLCPGVGRKSRQSVISRS